jgi:hypothetical protein
MGIAAVILTVITATLHLTLLTHHRTRLIMENLTTINNKNPSTINRPTCNH